MVTLDGGGVVPLTSEMFPAFPKVKDSFGAKRMSEDIPNLLCIKQIGTERDEWVPH